jgi:predicted acetyltransferase
MAAEHFLFGVGYSVGLDWTQYLDILEAERRGVDLPPDRVAATFLVADVDGQIVGRTSIRHELNEHLAREGGHVGYGVLVEHRRRGYATEILRHSLVVARAVGIDRVLVTCDDGNVGSVRVIERCGGVFESLIDVEDGPPKRRYWIDRPYDLVVVRTRAACVRVRGVRFVPR